MAIEQDNIATPPKNRNTSVSTHQTINLKESIIGILVTTPEAGLDYVLYGNNNRQTVANYVMNQINQLPQHFTDFGNRILEGAKATYNYLSNELLNRTIQAKVSDNNVYLDTNAIKTYNDIVGLQGASLTNQRWIMANPHLREIYLEQNCDGYSNTYVNPFKEGVGAKHYDYRRVMDGAVIDDPEHYYKVQFFDESLEFGDRDLTYTEKVSIRKTWDLVDWLLETGNWDFTNSIANTKMAR